MIDALTIVGADNSGENGVPSVKMQVDTFRSAMTTSGKENGENLLDHLVSEVIHDSKLAWEEAIMIEDFAQYLMSKWNKLIR